MCVDDAGARSWSPRRRCRPPPSPPPQVRGLDWVVPDGPTRWASSRSRPRSSTCSDPRVAPARRLQRGQHRARGSRAAAARRPGAEVERACGPSRRRARPHGAGLPRGPRRPRAVVDYAHTPEAVAAALRALRPTTAGQSGRRPRRGGDRDRGKRGRDGARRGGARRHRLRDQRQPAHGGPGRDPRRSPTGAREAGSPGAPRRGPPIGGDRAGDHHGIPLRPRDTVVVVGKGHETGQDIAGTIHPFDDREEVRKALQELIGAPRGADA